MANGRTAIKKTLYRLIPNGRVFFLKQYTVSTQSVECFWHGESHGVAVKVASQR